MSAVLVTFRCEDEPDVQVAAETGENLLKVARRAGVAVNAPCSGNGSCGKCLVQILKGDLDASKSFYISDVDYEEGWRLACTARVCQDVTLWVKEL